MERKFSKILQFLIILCTIVSLLLITAIASAAISISVISPNTISNTIANMLTVTGTDFNNGAHVSLDGYGALNTSYFSATTLMANIPANIPVGIYSVTVTNPDSSSSTLPNALTVISQSPATATPTLEPTNGYERPVIVVNSYDMSQERISPGDYFTLEITLYNAGQQYANNVVATFTPGDLIPRETGGVVAVGEIAPSNHQTLAQPFIVSSEAWGAVASINMVLTYTDHAGILYTETFAITLPVFHAYAGPATATPSSTPTQSATPSARAQLVITGYSTDVDPLQPGSQFNLRISIQNLGNATARHVTMIVGGGSSSSGGDGGTQQPGGISGGSGEFTNFAPIGVSNIQSLGDFTSGYSLTANQPLIVNVSTNPGAYPFKISSVYLDEQNRTFTDDQVITLLVYRLPQVEISFYQDVSSLFAGQMNTLPIQVVNLGRSSIVLGNMRIKAPSGQFNNNTILVGTLDPGGYFTLDAGYMPDQPGPVDLTISVDYTNDFNQSQVISKTLSVDFLEQPIIEPPIDGGQTGGSDMSPQQPETFFQKVWRFILGLFGLDSGSNTFQTIKGQPEVTTSPSDQPIIEPAAPPMKGP